MPLQIGNRYRIPGIGLVDIVRSQAKGKKKAAVRVSDGKRINFGAQGFRIGPGQDKGKRFCTRSLGLNKRGFNANTLSRVDWHCAGRSTSKKLPKGTQKVKK